MTFTGSLIILGIFERANRNRGTLLLEQHHFVLNLRQHKAQSRATCSKLRLDELDVVEWFNIFASKVIGCCIDRFYEMVWGCFQKHITTIAWDHRSCWNS
jgi:hypothetical protein